MTMPTTMSGTHGPVDPAARFEVRAAVVFDREVEGFFDGRVREDAPRAAWPLRAVEPALRREAPRCVDVLRVMRGLFCEKACVRERHPMAPAT